MNNAELDSLIVRLVKEGNTDRNVANILHVGRNRIQKVLEVDSENNILTHNMGRPTKLTRDVLEKIEQLTKEKSNLSDEAVSRILKQRHGLSISRSLVNKGRHQLRFRYLPPKTIQMLTKEQKQTRLQFAEDYLSCKIPSAPIIFSDESRFIIGEDNKWVWRRRNQFDESIFKEHAKFSSSIMVWGAIGLNYKSPLIIHYGIIDAEKYYTSIIESGVVEDANRIFGSKNYYLQQDGASVHTAQKTIDRLTSLINIFPGWPPNSPDFNPIESLWGYLKRELKWSEATRKEDAKALLLSAWDNIPFSIINSLVESFDRRLEMALDTRGSSITPVLSAQMSEVPNDYPLRNNDAYRLWTHDEDQLLLTSVETRGKRFKELEVLFLNRKAITLKARFKYLTELKRVDRVRLEVRSWNTDSSWPAFDEL